MEDPLTVASHTHSDLACIYRVRNTVGVFLEIQLQQPIVEPLESLPVNPRPSFESSESAIKSHITQTPPASGQNRRRPTVADLKTELLSGHCSKRLNSLFPDALGDFTETFHSDPSAARSRLQLIHGDTVLSDGDHLPDCTKSAIPRAEGSADRIDTDSHSMAKPTTNDNPVVDLAIVLLPVSHFDYRRLQPANSGSVSSSEGSLSIGPPALSNLPDLSHLLWKQELPEVEAQLDNDPDHDQPGQCFLGPRWRSNYKRAHISGFSTMIERINEPEDFWNCCDVANEKEAYHATNDLSKIVTRREVRIKHIDQWSLRIELLRRYTVTSVWQWEADSESSENCKTGTGRLLHTILHPVEPGNIIGPVWSADGTKFWLRELPQGYERKEYLVDLSGSCSEAGGGSGASDSGVHVYSFDRNASQRLGLLNHIIPTSQSDMQFIIDTLAKDIEGAKLLRTVVLPAPEFEDDDRNLGISMGDLPELGIVEHVREGSLTYEAGVREGWALAYVDGDEYYHQGQLQVYPGEFFPNADEHGELYSISVTFRKHVARLVNVDDPSQDKLGICIGQHCDSDPHLCIVESVETDSLAQKAGVQADGTWVVAFVNGEQYSLEEHGDMSALMNGRHGYCVWFRKRLETWNKEEIRYESTGMGDAFQPPPGVQKLKKMLKLEEPKATES